VSPPKADVGESNAGAMSDVTSDREAVVRPNCVTAQFESTIPGTPIKAREVSLFSMKKLHLSKNKMVAGVCAGMAEYLGIDPTVIRLIWVIIGVFTGVIPALIAYVLVWLFIPEVPSEAKSMP